jgi:hypothetical protein
VTADDLRALLRANPEAAVEAVDSAKIARPWKDGTRHALDGDVVAAVVRWSDRTGGPAGAMAEIDAHLLADGWVLLGGDRDR